MVIKLDMQKAFDRVSWGFLITVLRKFGFHTQFIDLIMNNLHGFHTRFIDLIMNNLRGAYFFSSCKWFSAWIF